MQKIFGLTLALVLVACAPATGDIAAPPALKLSWSAEEATLFPQGQTLTHAEDGVVLPDGTLLVGDYEHGLVTLAADGTKRPFGDFAAAGFQNAPSPSRGGPNGIAFEPDGRHVLVADIFTGAIYRADTKTQAVELIYDHPFGVNAVVRDSSGAIWFTQSTENPAGAGAEDRMFAAADRPLSDGAVFRIAPDQLAQTIRPADVDAEQVIAGLDFANGIAIDEQRGQLYVNEIVAGQVLSWDVDLVTGALSNKRVVAQIVGPDNAELDDTGNLWITSPIANAVYVIDPDTGEVRTAFSPTPEASAAISAEWERRIDAGESTLSLLGPPMWGPMPGLLTGVILTPGGGPVYVSGLGRSLVKLHR